MSSDSNITAFHHIFEQRLNKLLKQIKELRKNSGNKEYIKECIREAKKLKKKINKASKDINKSYFISVKSQSADNIITISDQIEISSIEEKDEITTIRFNLK